MNKAKIYKPTKTSMQSGKRKTKSWILEFETSDNDINPFTGLESSRDTMSEVKLEFNTKEEALNYANTNKIDFDLIEPQRRSIIKKSYTDNFLK